MLITVLDLQYGCRWGLRVQEREPAAFLGHDVVRQPAALQGRQGVRLLLPG